MAFKQLRQGGGNYTKWDKPKTVEGRILGYESGEYKGKPTIHVVLQQSDGTTTKCPVSAAISSVNNIEAPVGSQLRLVYKGKATGKSGQQYNDIEAFLEVPDGTEGSVAATSAPVVAVAPAAPATQAAPAPVQAVVTPTGPMSSTTAVPAAPASVVSSDYETDLATLALLNPAMAKQLPVVFPDPAVRAQKLKDVLAQLKPA